jgi:hypothetical protein
MRRGRVLADRKTCLYKLPTIILRTHCQDGSVFEYPANMSTSTARRSGPDTTRRMRVQASRAQLQAKITTDRAFRSSMPYLPDSSLLVFEDIPYRLKSPNDISKRLKVGIYKGEEYKIKGPV